MLEQLKYQNHANEIFEFGKDGIFVDVSELHDYSWDVAKKNNRIVSLDRSVVTRKLPITIICATEEEGLKARNKLLEVVEKDVLAMQHGKIIIGDYYFRCFVTKSQKKNYLTTKRHMLATLFLTSDFPYWVKETKYVISALSEDVTGNTIGFNYPFDYPFDYQNDVANKTVSNTDFAASNFRLTINGECVDPAIYIGDHLYQVYCTVNEGEYITIDSTSKTIIHTANNGAKTNVFNNRNKDSYIFEKIPPGKNVVSWPGTFTFEINILEERSEPRWI